MFPEDFAVETRPFASADKLGLERRLRGFHWSLARRGQIRGGFFDLGGFLFHHCGGGFDFFRCL